MDAAGGVEANQVASLPGLQDGIDDYSAFFRQSVFAVMFARLDFGRVQQMRVFGQMGKLGAQAVQHGQGAPTVHGKVAAQADIPGCVALADNDFDREGTLRHRSGLTDCAVIEANEVRVLRRKIAQRALLSAQVVDDTIRKLVEILLHYSPPKTSTSENTQAGAACPTRMT